MAPTQSITGHLGQGLVECAPGGIACLVGSCEQEIVMPPLPLAAPDGETPLVYLFIKINRG